MNIYPLAVNLQNKINTAPLNYKISPNSARNNSEIKDSVSFSDKKTVNIPKIIRENELKLKDEMNECAVVINPKTGKIVEENLLGTAGEVSIASESLQGNIVLHNHPCEKADVTLGENDIFFAIHNRAKEIRAVAPSGKWFSFKLPEKLSEKDSEILTDIYLEDLFSNQEYVELRKKINVDKQGHYSNTAEELTYVSNLTSNLLTDIAKHMNKEGYSVEYKTGKY